MRSPVRIGAALAAAIALVLLAGACSGTSSAGSSSNTAGASTTTAASNAEAAAGDPNAATTTSLVPVGDPVNKFTLAVGDCVNRYESIDVTTRVACDSPHDREVFELLTYPAPFGEPYPGDQKLQDFAKRGCYTAFEPYTGSLYELSDLNIGAITPTKQNFEDAKARYRRITCYLNRSDGKPLVGSMRRTPG
jgi:hypothetical protein